MPDEEFESVLRFWFPTNCAIMRRWSASSNGGFAAGRTLQSSSSSCPYLNELRAGNWIIGRRGHDHGSR